MTIQYCAFCRKELKRGEKHVGKFCSEECESQAMKSTFTTMSVRLSTRNRLIVLQNDILSKTNVKVSYSDLIEHVFDLCVKVLETELPDKIIEEYKLYL